MAQLSSAQYDALERAITDGKRVVIFRRGTEYLVVPRRLRLVGGRELVEAANPTTGDRIQFYLDAIESIEVIG